MTNLLNCLRFGAFAQRGQLFAARAGGFPGKLDLDQLMVSKCAVEFGHDRIGQTVLTDANNRLERVSASPQFLQESIVQVIGSTDDRIAASVRRFKRIETECLARAYTRVWVAWFATFTV